MLTKPRLNLLCSAFAASIMKVTYGIEVKDSSNEYVHIAEEVITGFNEAAQPGHFLVDNIEWRKCGKMRESSTRSFWHLAVKYIPAWIPGAGFQRKAKYYKHYGLQMLNKPFDAVQKALVGSNTLWLWLSCGLLFLGYRISSSFHCYWNDWANECIR